MNTSKDRFYSCFGLKIKSSIPFPEILSGSSPEDVHLSLKRTTSAKDLPPSPSFFYKNKKITILWDKVGMFSISRKKITIVSQVKNPRLLRYFILGPVMGCLLHLRGFLVLHGSAVKTKKGAILFLGGKGWGKSTLAAFFNKKGYPVITDDIAAINFNRSKIPTLAPSYPRLRLWPDSISALGENNKKLPRLFAETKKRLKKLATPATNKAVSLKAIYVLAQNKRINIFPLSKQDGFLQLLKHTYRIEWTQEVNKKKHFLLCSRLAERVPVYKMERPVSFALIKDLITRIETNEN